jgi:hypothetical protein
MADPVVLFARSQVPGVPSYEQAELIGRSQVPAGPSYSQSALGGGKNANDQTHEDLGHYLRRTGDDQTHDDLGNYARATGYDETLDLYSQSTLRSVSQALVGPSYTQSALGGGKNGNDQTSSTLGYYYNARANQGSTVSLISANSIASGESVGAPQVNLEILPGSVSTGESVGQPTIIPSQIVLPPSIESAESISTPFLAYAQLLDASIPSAEEVGQPLFKGGKEPPPPVIHPPHVPGQGSIWFDHIPFAPVEKRQYLGCNLAEFSNLRMQFTVCEDLLLFMGGPQFNGFVVPEVRAADVELVPVTYRRSGVSGRKVMY